MEELVYIPITTQDPEQLNELVSRTDPTLTFLRDLDPKSTTCRTLLVTQAEAAPQDAPKGGNQRILKIRQTSNNVWDDTYFYYEIHALHRVAERNLTNVTHLIREYETETHHAILKTYAEGTPLNTVDHERLLKDQAFIKKLDELYLKLHLAGIARINFQPKKIVIAADDELILVDLSTCIVNTESGISMFSREMRSDSRFITLLEKAARKAAKAAA